METMELQNRPITIESQDLIDLVQAAQAGRQEAFEELFSRHDRAVFAIGLARLGDETEARDLCQEVFMRAVTKLHQLQDPLCFGAWLRSIANRMAINRAMRRRPFQSIESDWVEERCVEEETPLGQVLARERRDQVHLGLNRLSEMDRQTLEAFYFRGCSLVEMSDEFESPVGTIKRRLHVARKRLAKELAELAPA